MDACNNVYVVDDNNKRIQKFNSCLVYQGQVGTTNGGSSLQAAYRHHGGRVGQRLRAEGGGRRIEKFNSCLVYGRRRGR